MKTGVLTSGVSGDFEHALAVIREDGFRYVEIQFAWGVEDGSRTPIQEEKIRQLLNRYGMQCTAVMRNLFSGLRLDETSLDSRAYRASLDMLRSTAALARSYGCTLTRINAFDRHAVLFGDGGAEKHLTAGNKSWARYLRLMEPVCQIAEDEGIDIMIETGTGSLLHTAALMRRALDELGCSRLYALWDPANCLYTGERPYPDGYEILRGRIAEIHIKDIRFRRELASVTYCPVGQGMMTQYLDDLAAALRRDAFAGGVILENQVTPSGGTEEDGYRLSVPVFRTIFGRS